MTEENSKTAITAASLIRDLESLRGRRCFDCAAPVCSHETLMSIAMGFKDAPRCLKCLAAQLQRDATELRDYLFAYIQGRDCYREAWIWASRAENFSPSAMPNCLWRKTESARPAVAPYQRSNTPTLQHSSSSHTPIPPFSHSTSWDAGDMGCGDLVLELRIRMNALQSGEILKLTARDLGAPEDLPSWCRMTGHKLLRAEPPDYWIQKV
jgi:tRNA 2-thiouridine synthesizing protein A